MVNQVKSKRKGPGPLVRVREIEALVADLRVRLAAIYESPHPHVMKYSGVLPVCPEDCPVAIERHAVSAVLQCLWNDRQAALEDNLISRQESVQRPTVTLEMYDEARKKVKNTKAPRTNLAKELLLTGPGLIKWEKRNRKR